MSRETSWSRLGMEAFVVVVSILLALAVDEWRDGLANRSLEREYLERLRQDLASNLDDINQQHAAQASELESARLVYPFVAWGDWKGLDTARAVRASYLATPSPTPSWVDDTFEELKSTGRMSLIKDPGLRAALLAYYRYLDAADYAYELMSTSYRDAVREHMEPELQMRLRRDCQGRSPECGVPVAGRGLADYVKWLQRNEELAGGLRRVILQWTRGEEEYLPRVERRTRGLIEQIDHALAGTSP